MPAIESSAPGKLVVSGEYAVLGGAPALVAALERRVTCRLQRAQEGGWRFDSIGHVEYTKLSREELLACSPTSLAGVVREILPPAEVPAHMRVTIDSSACFHGGTKLGIGSSAAAVTAFGAAVAAIAGRRFDLAGALRHHRAMQGGGSGLDVAASYTGGVIRYRSGAATPARLPAGVALTAVFTGASTPTGDMLRRFEAWRRGGDPTEYGALREAASQVADVAEADSPDDFVRSLERYSRVLAELDDAGSIGIFGPGHRTAARLAAQSGVVYKPCGAGGGDTGIACAADAGAVERFAAHAREAGLHPIAFEIATRGVTVRPPPPGRQA